MNKTKAFLNQSYLKLSKKYIDKIEKIYPLNERMQNMILSIASISKTPDESIIK